VGILMQAWQASFLCLGRSTDDRYICLWYYTRSLKNVRKRSNPRKYHSGTFAISTVRRGKMGGQLLYQT